MGNIEIRHIAWNFETENSFNLAVKRQSSVNSTPSYILQCCPVRDFGGEQCHCEMSRDLEVTSESAPCLEEISSYITIRSLPASLLFKDQGAVRVTMNWPVLFGAAHHSKLL